MSAPMYDIPDHLWMGVNAEGQGPVDSAEEAADWVCWCGISGCTKPLGPRPTP